MNRRDTLFAAIALGAAARPFAARTQAVAPRVTLVIAGSVRTQAERVDAFRNRLGELGYVEGRNLNLEIRELEGRFDQLPRMMQEIVASRPNVIVTHGLGVAAAKAATSTIPVVAAITGDPVKEGIAASLARPGGNFTGNSLILGVSAEKSVQILHEIVPAAKRVGLLTNTKNANCEASRNIFEATAAARRLNPVFLHAITIDDIHKAFADAAAQRVDMLVVSAQDELTVNPKPVADLAARQRLRTGDLWREHCAAVCQCRGVRRPHSQGREARRPAVRAAGTVRDGDQPQGPKALGLKIPQSVLMRADRVIE